MSSPNAELRELEVRGLLRDLEELSDLPCVLAGDFDAGRREAPLRELLRAGFRESVRKARPELVAFDDEIRATGGKLLGPKKLDFVLVDDGSALLDAALEPVPSEGSRRTHFPVWADVVLRR